MATDGATGVLLLVSTPIGNLDDMTYRGVEALRGADVVLAEDTRRTRKLLAHYDVHNELVSYHDHNKERVTPRLIERLKAGERMALVSDAGTPGISDPGFYLARAARDEGIHVTVVPGANAILPALLLSGFPTDAFLFDGFLPRKKGDIARCFAAIADERRTAIFFISPHRLVKSLEIAAEVLGERPLAVVREISKVHEEVVRGTASELVARFRQRAAKGEIVLVVHGREK